MPRVYQDGISGVVFADRNGNGARDASEPGIAGVAVSDQDTVVVTDRAGRYRLVGRNGTGVVFVSVPEGYRAAGRFWAPATSGAIVDFPLRRLAPRSSTPRTCTSTSGRSRACAASWRSSTPSPPRS